jgi:23S rRNA (cytosine1962-C5)-methyltransferase
MIEKIKEAKKEGRDVKVLNLFAYTGAATVACSYAGAEVCHVDSSKGMTAAAKENVDSSGLSKNKVRYIVDDVIKFVKREIRRGSRYDCIVMDPPSYGRGASGEVWSIEKDLYNLVCLCSQLLSDNPIFFSINTYTGGLSGTVISNVLKMAIEENTKGILNKGRIVTNEIGIKMTDSNLMLPCGITTRWEII